MLDARRRPRAPHRVAAAYLELAVLVRALEGSRPRCAGASARTAASLWAGLFDLRENLLGRAHDDLRARVRRPAQAIGRAMPRGSPSSARSTSTSSRACERLPRPGETVRRRRSRAFPAARARTRPSPRARLGARVRMIGAVGDDAFADEALAGLREAGVELELERVGEQTGVALIFVDDAGENEIVVAPGATRRSALELPADGRRALPARDPGRGRVSAAAQRGGLFCLNAAPARPVAVEPDLLVVNRFEHEVALRARRARRRHARRRGRGAARGRRGVARATPPPVDAVDGTAAGDAFTACLIVSLLEGREPRGGAAPRLRRGCARGVAAGAQPSLPTAAEVDAILERTDAMNAVVESRRQLRIGRPDPVRAHGRGAQRVEPMTRRSLRGARRLGPASAQRVARVLPRA